MEPIRTRHLKIRIFLKLQNNFRENERLAYVASFTFRCRCEEAGRRLLGLVEELVVTFTSPSYTHTYTHTHAHTHVRTGVSTCFHITGAFFRVTVL